MTSFLLANACTGAFKMRSMKEKGGVCMRRLGIDVSEHNGVLAVSYTHLDVYKRQGCDSYLYRGFQLDGYDTE